MKLFKRGDYFHIKFDEKTKRSFKSLIGYHVTNRKIAEKLMAELEEADLRAKIARIQAKKGAPRLSELKTAYSNTTRRSGHADKSHASDGYAIQKFIDALGDIPITGLNKKTIEKATKQMQKIGLAVSSINSYLSRMQAAYHFALDEEMIPPRRPPKFHKIKKTKEGKKQNKVQPFTLGELAKIRETMQENPKWKEMAYIIEFVLFTGARRIEVVRLKAEDIWEDMIEFHGKGSKMREIMLLPQAAEATKKGSEITRVRGYIFEYRHEQTLTNYFRMICKEAGVKGHFHMLRHTAATEMFAAGISKDIIKDILGHADIRTTEIYVHVREANIRNAMSKMVFQEQNNGTN